MPLTKTDLLLLPEAFSSFYNDDDPFRQIVEEYYLTGNFEGAVDALRKMLQDGLVNEQDGPVFDQDRLVDERYGDYLLTALILTSTINAPNITKFLIDNGANPTLKCSIEEEDKRFTALEAAFECEHYETVKLLLKYEADFIEEQTGLTIAVGTGQYLQFNINQLVGTRQEYTRLTDAAMNENIEKVIFLLENDADPYLGEKSSYHTVFDLARKNDRIFDALKENISRNLKDYTEKYASEDKLHFMGSPNDALAKIVNDKLKINSQRYPELKKLFTDFLKSKDQLATQRLDRLSVAHELLTCIENPKLFPQSWGSNLCGMVTLSQVMLMDTPKAFVKMALELASEGKTRSPVEIKASHDCLMNATNISGFVTESMRHTFNILGYHPANPNEAILGATRPKRLVSFLEGVGYAEIQESMVVNRSNRQELPTFFRAALGGIYSNKHTDYDTPASLCDAFLENMKTDNKRAIAHFSRELTDAIIYSRPLRQDTGVSANAAGIDFIPIEQSHYVVIKSICEEKSNDGTDMVSVTLFTYGAEHTAKIPKDQFIEGFRGAIIATTPQAAMHIKFKTKYNSEIPENEEVKAGKNHSPN